MRIRARLILSIVALLAHFSMPISSAAAGATQAEGLPVAEPAAFARIGGQAKPMIGWTLFCQAQPLECSETRLAPVAVILTPGSWAELNAINALANKQIKPIGDDDHYGISKMGVPNWWTYPDDGSGNCNDYVLLKRRLLIEAGWPKSALLMTVVVTPEGEGHLVLTVRTDRGDLILDNVREKILVWNKVGYRFVKRQSAANHNVWLSIEADELAPATSAASSRVSSR
ncbi:putative transglutaminase-like cysteine proteinase [Bosea sp. OAE752]|uniref:transglutaminase-like cysteine peptidase n=1 Tax=unclassified Bosea (in: a-proteobacteria) TaxID=2653178 RepID=UPI00114F5F8C